MAIKKSNSITLEQWRNAKSSLVAEARDEVLRCEAALEDARNVLEELEGPTKAKVKAQPKANGKRIRTSGAEIDARAGKVFDALKKEGTRLPKREIARLAGVALADAGVPLRKLLTDKKIKTAGERRNTVYWAV